MATGLILGGGARGVLIKFHEMFELIVFSWKDHMAQPLNQAVFF